MIVILRRARAGLKGAVAGIMHWCPALIRAPNENKRKFLLIEKNVGIQNVSWTRNSLRRRPARVGTHMHNGLEMFETMFSQYLKVII